MFVACFCCEMIAVCTFYSSRLHLAFVAVFGNIFEFVNTPQKAAKCFCVSQGVQSVKTHEALSTTSSDKHMYREEKMEGNIQIIVSFGFEVFWLFVSLF